MSSQQTTLVIAGGELAMTAAGEAAAINKELNEEVIRSWLPADLAPLLKIVDWSRQPGSHYTVRMTGDLVDLLSKQVADGSQSVVVACGADALEEMAYLADLLWLYPQPLVFAATHMAPDVPGSDAITSLLDAINAARSTTVWGQGVLVCSGGYLYAASDVVETANYGRGGFEGIYRGAIGSVVQSTAVLWQAPKRSRIFDVPFAPARHVELLYASLGGGERFLRLLTESDKSVDGLVVAGFGGGSVPPSWLPYIKTLVRGGIPVVAASRCLRGCVLDARVFEGSFSRLQELGVMSAGFLSPLQARLKLAVGIGAGLKDAELQKYILDN